MARILLEIGNIPNRMTLKAMLEADGHIIITESPDLVIADTPSQAVAYAQEHPVLLICTAHHIAEAVLAMRQGVYGYIFLPLQPGEAPLMVRRALEAYASGLVRKETDSKAPEDLSLQAAEARHIHDVLRRCKNNQAEAARVLGVGRNTLWRKLKEEKKRLSRKPYE
ncbi:MAG TPA: helix-turn-helix domain-containing protein [Candidatus Hydrogenedentes bacterium]|nr:helix-turn-helix domain-containing protein [Candidatus Hydrogenedentota bacterium]